MIAALVVASLIGAWFAPLLPVVALLDLVFVAVFLFDFWRTPRPDRLDVRRRVPPRAGLSQDFTRVVRVDAGSLTRARGRLLEVHEEFPQSFEVRSRTISSEDPEARTTWVTLAPPAPGDPSGGPDRCVVPLSGAVDLSRSYRSAHRGVQRLKDLRLRLRGRLGLVERQARMRKEQAIEIEPALLGLRRTLRLAASERWRDLGVHRLARRGSGMEFESLREHVHGDDLRTVDWKAFAKRGRPIVRQFQVERGQELVLLVDAGRRMGAVTDESSVAAAADRPLAGWTKLDHALDAALELGAVALAQGDRVGVMAFDARVLCYVQPARGMVQLARLRRALFDLQASALESDLERAVRELALVHRRRALVVILSDVADPLSVARQRRALAASSKRHKLLFAALDDPGLRLAAGGALGVPGAVRAAALVLNEERSQSLREIARSGVRVIDALPAETAAPLLAAWLEMRRGALG